MNEPGQQQARDAVIDHCAAHGLTIHHWEPVYYLSACAYIGGGYVASNRWGDVVYANSYENMVTRLARVIAARLEVTK